MANEHETIAGHRNHPLTDILIAIGVAAAAFAIELDVAEHLPWGDEARGVIAVLVGAITAVALTLRGGGTFADLGFTRPKRWWTVPIWVIGILLVLIPAQGLVPQLLAPIFDLPPPDMSRYDALRGNLPAAVATAHILLVTQLYYSPLLS